LNDNPAETGFIGVTGNAANVADAGGMRLARFTRNRAKAATRRGLIVEIERFFWGIARLSSALRTCRSWVARVKNIGT